MKHVEILIPYKAKGGILSSTNGCSGLPPLVLDIANVGICFYKTKFFRLFFICPRYSLLFLPHFQVFQKSIFLIKIVLYKLLERYLFPIFG